ncbi:MAG: CPBP family glutamic-type intramembrane protease [Pseudolabrys sp.]|nr:CPBP family glutamic-type intramembrane protease [Pseudolabrys sp.]
MTLSTEQRPGWPEIFIGLAVFGVTGFGGGLLLVLLGIDPVISALIFMALSGAAAAAGFLAVGLTRRLSWHALGLRPTSRRWLLIGTATGLGAFLVKGLAVAIYVALFGKGLNPQDIYGAGGSGGLWTILAGTFLLGIVTPIGEELLFRGVVANALLRYGPFIGVTASALIFALMHGVNIVFPAAVVAGLACGEIFRRSGSVYPAILVHVVFNLPTIPVMALIATAQ